MCECRGLLAWYFFFLFCRNGILVMHCSLYLKEFGYNRNWFGVIGHLCLSRHKFVGKLRWQRLIIVTNWWWCRLCKMQEGYICKKDFYSIRNDNENCKILLQIVYTYKMYATRFYVSSFFSQVSRFVWLTVSDFVWRKVYVERAFFLLFVLYRVVF